ncbi:MAG TPA: short-chain dehydrogenase, partial [Pseudomonas sp.]|nr:short-chain dehydrogenase [Pseudomonas sp.]
NARMNESLVEVTGHNADQSRQQFNDLLLRTSPDKAAAVILRGVQRNQRRILIGLDARGVDLMMRSMPSLYQRMVVLSLRLAARFAPKAPGTTPEVAE